MASKHQTLKTLFCSSVAMAVLAGCGTGPSMVPTIEHGMGFGGTVPSIQAGAPNLEAGAAGFKIFVNDVTHPSNSFVLATNRNHVSDNFPNGAAKLAKLKELRPSWGQGRYMYRIGHGPTDGRNDYNYMTGYHFEQHWNKNGGYPYDDLRNALKDANDLDAEQLHVVNFGTGTAEEAGRYVSYLNNPNDANRKQYPFPVQNAKYFEIGNEISWSMVRGHAEHAATETQYAKRAKEFAQAMRKSSPTPIKIGAVASTNSAWRWDGGGAEDEIVKNILTTMGTDVDFLIYHGYPSWPIKNEGDLNTYMAQNAWNDRLLTQKIEPAIKQYAKHNVQIANTEFFTEQYNDTKKARGLFGAIYSADTVSLALNHNMLVANQFCLDHGESADAAFFYGDNPERVTPIFQFQKMLAKHWGDQQIKVDAQAIPTNQVGDIAVPKLGITASKGRNGKVYVMVTNRTQSEAVNAKLALGFTPKSATAHVLSGTAGWDSDENNTKVETKAVGLNGAYSFPAASVTILEITP